MAFPTTSDPCSNYSYIYIGWTHKKSPESCRETFSSVSLEEIYQSQGCVSSEKAFQVSISHCLGKRMWSPKLGSGAGCRAWVQEAGITPGVLYCSSWEAGASQGLRAHAQVYSTGAILTKRWKIPVLPRMGRTRQKWWRVLPSSAALWGLSAMRHTMKSLLSDWFKHLPSTALCGKVNVVGQIQQFSEPDFSITPT